MKAKKYELEYGGQFLKDLKLAKRRGLNMKDLSDITDLLQEGTALPERCRDHILTGNYKGYRECLKRLSVKERENWYLMGGGVTWDSCPEVIHIEQIFGNYQNYAHEAV